MNIRIYPVILTFVIILSGTAFSYTDDDFELSTINNQFYYKEIEPENSQKTIKIQLLCGVGQPTIKGLIYIEKLKLLILCYVAQYPSGSKLVSQDHIAVYSLTSFKTLHNESISLNTQSK